MALTTLLRYPTPSGAVTPQSLVLDALYLRDHLHQAGASHLIEKHSGRPLPKVEASNESSLPTSAQSMLGTGLQAVGLSPPSPGKQAGNIDRILQDAAKGMFKRGEQWGINKAVRDAIVEVRKGVREIQNTPTPQRPRTHLRTSSRQSGADDTAAAFKLANLEQRNTMLAKMLKNATDDLWKYHEKVVAGKSPEKADIEGLSVAIAKVQFTHVYLEDSTVPLSGDENPEETSEDVPKLDTAKAPDGDKKAEEGPKSPDATIPRPPSKSRPKKSPSISSQSQMDEKSTGVTDIPKDFQTPRPALTQSSFSWMLGQDQGTSSFVQANPLPPSDARRRSRGFLFGDEEASSARVNSPKDAGRGKGASILRKHRPGSISQTTELLFEQESEVWDLGKLEEEKRREKKEREKKELLYMKNEQERKQKATVRDGGT